MLRFFIHRNGTNEEVDSSSRFLRNIDKNSNSKREHRFGKTSEKNSSQVKSEETGRKRNEFTFMRFLLREFQDVAEKLGTNIHTSMENKER